MSKKNIGCSFDNFLSENAALHDATTVAVSRVSAWQIEELRARWTDIERGDVEVIPAAKVFADIRRKLQ